jgi:hypothetical protein
MKYSHSKAMAVFYKIVKLVKNLGIDISKTANYKEGQLTRFVSLEYKSDLRFINSLKLPSNSTFNTITMGFIVS